MFDKEKDKLFFCFIVKEEVLVNCLIFELLEGVGSWEERCSEFVISIEWDVIYVIWVFYLLGFLLFDLCVISGDINWYVKAIKDKYGEIEFNLLMFNLVLEGIDGLFDQFLVAKVCIFFNYVVKWVLKL